MVFAYIRTISDEYSFGQNDSDKIQKLHSKSKPAYSIQNKNLEQNETIRF